MQVTKISGIASNVHSNNAKAQSFKGHWEDQTWGAPYPYEDSSVNVKVYVADVDESFEEISRNFQAQAKGKGPERDIFQASRGSVYSIGGVNYFTDLSQNREAQKRNYTISSEQKIKERNWVGAVEDKLKIAKILKEQGPKMEKDKFLTEEGIRNIFYRADGSGKKTIANMVKGYSVEMSKPLFDFLRRPIF